MHDSPLLVFCWLCGDRIETTTDQAWGSSIDHALDTHRDYLFVDPDRVWDALTVSPAQPSLPAPRRACPREVGDVLP